MYTAPIVTYILLYAHVANVGSSPATVTMKHARSGTDRNYKCSKCSNK